MCEIIENAENRYPDFLSTSQRRQLINPLILYRRHVHSTAHTHTHCRRRRKSPKSFHREVHFHFRSAGRRLPF